MPNLFQSIDLGRGPELANRFMLAPLTNTQSHVDGTLSDEEFRWLTMRAQGGFAATMTCAAHVQAIGQGFPGQLGVFSDTHLAGLTRLASAIKAAGSVALCQLHHAGMRSPADLIGQAPVCPSDDAETGSRALSLAEVARLIEDFIVAAERARAAGFDGVEVHGAHGYILCQFLSEEINHRTDAYGGSAENRARIIVEILQGIRDRCGSDFILGLRLSPERFGLKLVEIVDLARNVMRQGLIDFLDMSLWDHAKEPTEAEFKGRSLMSYFTELDRGGVALGVAGKITTAATAQACLVAGADFVLIGRGAVLHHDFPRRVEADPQFATITLPVTRAYLAGEGLGAAFIDYMNNWPGFVAAE